MESTFRPAGWGRFVVIPFLLFWLAGWGVFEWLAIRGIYWLLTGQPDAVEKMIGHPVGWGVGLFGLVWIALWTFGGVSAILTVLRLAAGVDRIQILGVEWVIFRGIGPIGITTRVQAQDIRDVYLDRRDKRVVIETAARDVLFTTFGTPEQRREFVKLHGRRTALEELPRGWAALPHEGATKIARTSVEGAGCLTFLALIASLFLALSIRYRTEMPTGMLIGFTIAAFFFGALALWGVFRREELLVRHDRIAQTVQWLGWRREKVLDPRSLEVTFSTDSDGDERATLQGTVSGKKLVLHSTLNDARAVIRLARRIEKASGWRVEMPPYRREG